MRSPVCTDLALLCQPFCPNASIGQRVMTDKAFAKHWRNSAPIASSTWLHFIFENTALRMSVP